MEENVAYFQIERSIDGTHFIGLGTLAAAGHSTSLQTYEYIDQYEVRGTVYYRIAEYDVNGTKMYSGVKAVNGLLKKLNLSVYPNPSVNSFSVFVEGEESGNINLMVYDVLGNVAETQIVSANTSAVIGEHLSRGAYILHVQKSDEAIITQKLIKE